MIAFLGAYPCIASHVASIGIPGMRKKSQCRVMTIIQSWRFLTTQRRRFRNLCEKVLVKADRHPRGPATLLSLHLLPSPLPPSHQLCQPHPPQPIPLDSEIRISSRHIRLELRHNLQQILVS